MNTQPTDSRYHITHLINQYGFTIDTGDLQSFAALFADGVWEVEGSEPCVGSQQVLDALATVRIYDDGTPRTKHVISNLDLAIDEAGDSAQSQCYITLFQQTDDFPMQAIFCGHYFDEFVRIDNRWRFSHRLIKNMLVGDLSAHHADPSSIVASG